MIFYFYTIGGPILILLVSFLITSIKPKHITEYVDLLLKTIPHLFGYAFFLYFLEREKYIATSWSFYSVIFFLIPLSLLILILKVNNWIKSRK